MSRLFDLFEKRERAYAELKKDGGLIVLSPEGVAKHKAALKEFEHWDEQFREEMRQAAEAQRQVEYVHDDLDRLHERFSEPGGWSFPRTMDDGKTRFTVHGRMERLAERFTLTPVKLASGMTWVKGGRP